MVLLNYFIDYTAAVILTVFFNTEFESRYLTGLKLIIYLLQVWPEKTSSTGVSVI